MKEKIKNKKSLWKIICNDVGWLVVIGIIGQIYQCATHNPTACNSQETLSTARLAAEKALAPLKAAAMMYYGQNMEISDFQYVAGIDGAKERCTAKVSLTNGKVLDFYYTSTLNAEGNIYVEGNFPELR